MNLYMVGSLSLLAAAAVIYRGIRRLPGDTPWTIARQVLTGLLVFGLIGPLIGMVVVKILIPIPQLEWNFGGVQISYLIGGLPAMLCGVTAGTLKPNRPARALWPAMALTWAAGALYGFAFVLSIIGVDRVSSVGDAVRAGALPGLTAAIVCGLVFFGWPTTSNPGPAASTAD